MTSRVRSSHSSHSQPTMMYSATLLLSLLASAHGFASNPEPGSVPPKDQTVSSPRAAPRTCTAGVDTSPACPYDAVAGDSIKICPSNFPTFTPSKDEAPSCEVAVIGAQPSLHNMHAITPHAHPRVTIDTAVLACARRRRYGRSVLGTALG